METQGDSSDVSDCRPRSRLIQTDGLPEGQCELKLRFGAIPIGAHLGFTKDASSFDGLASGRAIVNGIFDADGVSASGRVFLTSAGIESGGRRYACKSASANWSARR